MNIRKQVQENHDHTVKLRRHLHQYPESSLQEYKTQEFIIENLKKLDIPFKKTAETGVIGTIGSGEKCVALRADIDALEMEDLKDTDYASKIEGMAHTCGHDAHTAMLLSAAQILKENEDSLNGKVLLVFQPAEENLGGAKIIMEEGHLEGVDSILGLHVMPSLETGKIGYKYGSLMSASDSFQIDIQGVGGHGSMPHLTVDSTVAATVYSTDKILDFLLDTTLPKIDVEVVEIPRFTGSEDFSYFLEEIPGAYLIVGTNGGEETSYANHHPLFDIFIYYHQLYAKAFNLDII